ncbi:MAG: hypothetical protein R3275_12540 [Saprospiraceae bacterium]|nr:hypothetical protein [Saprospiraceae bacterium]
MIKRAGTRLIPIIAFMIMAVQGMAGSLLVTKKMILRTAKEAPFIPVWLLVIVIALVVLFTVLLILSPVGSSKRRGKRKPIFGR